MSLASRGLRDLDTGEEKVGDAAELAALRIQARRINIKSSITGLVFTALALLWP